VLCSAEDAKTGELVAIKKLRHVFETSSTSRRALREIKLLRQLQHENVLSLLDIVAPQSYKKFDDVYMVTELMDTDLHNVRQPTFDAVPNTTLVCLTTDAPPLLPR
jgi:serine/threonine protein kinase